MRATGLNPFFNFYNNRNEQTLIDSLLTESIQIFGVQVYYMPRTLGNFNKLYGEDTLSQYNQAFLIEMYPRNNQGFGGDGDFLSIIGTQIRDTLNLSVSKSRFFQEIGDPLGFPRPREGDLIYFPFNKKLFVIKFVEHEAIFYQLGQLQTYDLELELWEYSNEVIATGIDEIDTIGKQFSFDSTEGIIYTNDDFALASSDGYPLVQSSFNMNNSVGEYIADNDLIEEQFKPLIDPQWNDNNDIGELE